MFLFWPDSVCCKAAARHAMRRNRASRAPRFSLNLCSLVAITNELHCFWSPPLSFAAAGELAVFGLAVIDRAMAQPLCIRNEVSGSVSNVAVGLLASPTDTKQGLAAPAIAIPSFFPFGHPARASLHLHPHPKIPCTGCLAPSQVHFGWCCTKP